MRRGEKPGAAPDRANSYWSMDARPRSTSPTGRMLNGMALSRRCTAWRPSVAALQAPAPTARHEDGGIVLEIMGHRHGSGRWQRMHVHPGADQQALDENAAVMPNRKQQHDWALKSAHRACSEYRRLGDLRLECQVGRRSGPGLETPARSSVGRALIQGARLLQWQRLPICFFPTSFV